MDVIEYLFTYLSFGALCLVIWGAMMWPIQTLIDLVFRHKEGSKPGFFHVVVSLPAYSFSAIYAGMIAWKIFDYFDIKIL
jgi:hypothetical protein